MRNSQVFLASPLTVAASAARRARITDPRDATVPVILTAGSGLASF